MGYSYCDKWKNLDDVKDSILSDIGDKLVAKSAYGNEFYTVVKNNDGKNYIVLFLINGRNGQYGYKAIGEEAFPYYFNCPEKLLKLSECEIENAVNWRNACRKYRSDKAKAEKLVKESKHGDVINTDFGLVTYQYALKGKAFAALNKDGKLFRYYPKQVIV